MKRKIRQILCFLLACQLFTITALARPDWPSDTGIQAEAGIVMDMDSGAVLIAQNSHLPYPPASITKLLTALIVLEHASLDETVTFSETAVYSVESDSGNRTSVVAGDQLSVEDCLYALLLVSSNQTANALAEHVAGSISDFVVMMNEKLAELGCEESHFDNPSGLNGDTQYVSAYDMALIGQAAFNNEQLLEISSATSHTIGATSNNPDGLTLRNEHRLLITDDSTSPYYCPSAVAGKTGYLLAAGNTLVTYAEQDGRRLVSVILKGQPRQYFVDAKTLIEFGFSRFTNVTIADRESRYVTGDEPIQLGDRSYPASDLMVEPGKVVTLPGTADFTDADLELGAIPEGMDHPANALALLTYTYNERVIGTAFLMTKEMPPEAAAPAGDGREPGSSDTDEAGENGVAGTGTGENSTRVDENGTGADGTGQPSDGSGSTAPGGEQGSAGGISVLSAIAIGAVVLVILLAAAAIAWIMYRRKKEAEELARRRALRRKRLQEAGEEEEFNRMLEELKQKKQRGE